jgi:hypothetical protein
MVAQIHEAQSNETHEEFVRRASKVFLEDQVSSWSRIERGVFNYLMARLINKCGYSAITHEMLQESRNNMEKIVRCFATGRLAD